MKVTNFYDLLGYHDCWPPRGIAVEDWLKTEDAVEYRRVMPSDSADTFPLIQDHCNHAGGLTIAGQCLLCGGFPRGNQFKRSVKR